MTEDKRGAVRIDTLNLLYVGIYEERQLVKHAIGRTLNVSQKGILLEMHFPIETGQSVSLAIALEDDLVKIEGQVVYIRSGNDRKFEIGIEFLEMDEHVEEILNKYIDAFKSQA